MKTSAITIRRATKFIAMLRPLHFNTKIHTCALNIIFVGKDMLQSRFKRKWEPYLSRLGLIPAK